MFSLPFMDTELIKIEMLHESYHLNLFVPRSTVYRALYLQKPLLQLLIDSCSWRNITCNTYNRWLCYTLQHTRHACTTI